MLALERFATHMDRVTTDLLDLEGALLDTPPGPGVAALCAVLTRLRAVDAAIPLDDRNSDGSILFSPERLRTMLSLHREAVRLLGNVLALTAAATGAERPIEWLAHYRRGLDAATVLLMLPAPEVWP